MYMLLHFSENILKLDLFYGERKIELTEQIPTYRIADFFSRCPI